MSLKSTEDRHHRMEDKTSEGDSKKPQSSSNKASKGDSRKPQSSSNNPTPSSNPSGEGDNKKKPQSNSNKPTPSSNPSSASAQSPPIAKSISSDKTRSPLPPSSPLQSDSNAL